MRGCERANHWGITLQQGRETLLFLNCKVLNANYGLYGG